MGLRQRIAHEIVRRHKVLSKVLPRGYHAYPTAGGKILLDVRESPMMLARVLRVYEPAKILALQNAMAPGKTFVDVGGNKGDFSLIAAKSTGDSARILCVEPEPTNVNWIRRSVERNKYTSIEVVPAALAAADGEATLHLGVKSGWHTLVDDPNQALSGDVTVQTRTLDGLLAERGIDHVDVIKIDVEGAEDLVLAGGTKTFSGDKPMVVLLDLHPPRVDPVAICKQLEAWGFELCDPENPSRPLPGGPTMDLKEVVACRR